MFASLRTRTETCWRLSTPSIPLRICASQDTRETAVLDTEGVADLAGLGGQRLVHHVQANKAVDRVQKRARDGGQNLKAHRLPKPYGTLI